MPLVGQTYYLAGSPGANFNEAQQQLSTGGGNAEQTLVLEKDCSAVMLSARTANAYVTFNNTTASSANGLEIIAGAQPVFIPLGYNAGGTATPLRVIGAAINTIVNVLQLR